MTELIERRTRHNISLSREAREIIEDLQEATGLSFSAVIECLARDIPIRELREPPPARGEE
jgi:hypothetical protein